MVEGMTEDYLCSDCDKKGLNSTDFYYSKYLRKGKLVVKRIPRCKICEKLRRYYASQAKKGKGNLS